MTLPTWITRWFDPDRNWKSKDKILHYLSGLVVCAILTIFIPPFSAVVWTTLLGLAWEGGQADIGNSAKLLGKPGYGIGLLDLAADAAGALTWAIILWVF